MATSPLAQHYVECTQCGRNAKYYCNTCNDNLCAECKINHKSEHHDVVIYGEKKMIELCKVHSGLPFIMCCQGCEVPVCQKCIKEKHKKHLFVDIDEMFESKIEEYNDQVSVIEEEHLPICTAMIEDVQSDRSRLKELIGKIQLTMKSKAQTLKDIIDKVLADGTHSLKDLENSILAELEQQENEMSQHVTSVQNAVDECKRYISSDRRAGCILFQHENPFTKLTEMPSLTEITLPSFTGGQVNTDDLTEMFGKIQKPQKTAIQRKCKNKPIVKKTEPQMNQIPSATKVMNFKVSNVYNGRHISLLTRKQAWISDDQGNLIMTDMKGEMMDDIIYAKYKLGCHTTSERDDIIFLNKDEDTICKVTTNKKRTPITKVPHGSVRSIYSSPSNGDILVGMVLDRQSLVTRYKRTGQEVNKIQYDNKGKSLYSYPRYITENRINGDICVSDRDIHAIVVVNRDGNHRFSYTGHPPKSMLLPYGITTDTQGHILVSDKNSDTVQMINKDGHFISFLLTKEHGIKKPAGLSLDVKNNLLWVGRFTDTTVSVYRYNPKHENK